MGPSLIDSKSLPDSGRARIWIYENGQYLFEVVRPSGKGLSVFLPSYEAAVRWWRSLDSGAPETRMGTT